MIGWYVAACFIFIFAYQAIQTLHNELYFITRLFNFAFLSSYTYTLLSFLKSWVYNKFFYTLFRFYNWLIYCLSITIIFSIQIHFFLPIFNPV